VRRPRLCLAHTGPGGLGQPSVPTTWGCLRWLDGEGRTRAEACGIRSRLANRVQLTSDGALAVALFTTYYNFVRIHKTLRVPPAMAAGVTAKLWDVSDIVKVLEDWEAAT
jgi:hypothetical protein